MVRIVQLRSEKQLVAGNTGGYPSPTYRVLIPIHLCAINLTVPDFQSLGNQFFCPVTKLVGPKPQLGDLDAIHHHQVRDAHHV